MGGGWKESGVEEPGANREGDEGEASPSATRKDNGPGGKKRVGGGAGETKRERRARSGFLQEETEGTE
jgi:hypothetical protein